VRAAVEAKLKEENLVNHPPWVDKTIELYEAATVRHGIIVVGPSGTFLLFPLSNHPPSRCTPHFIPLQSLFFAPFSAHHPLLILFFHVCFIGVGKSRCIDVLLKALTGMATDGMVYKLIRMNPKAITTNQMYGSSDVSNEWTDGIFSSIYRRVNRQKNVNSWISFTEITTNTTPQRDN
jgi:dynein heavy chain, axonemal